MHYTQIILESLGGGAIAKASINRPDSYNSLNKDTLIELRHFVQEANGSAEVRCIVISGTGKAFCAGQNLKDALQHTAEDSIHKMVQQYYNPLVLEICSSSKPVVALVNGPAVGAGAMLALICDITLATESAYFAQAFINIGLIPDTGGTYFLPKLMGRQQASYLALTGRKIYAREAKEAGWIADYFPDGNFQTEANAVLETLSKLPTKAAGLTKKAFNASYTNTLEEQLALEALLQQEAAETEDFREGVAAFVEKRKPTYKGK